MTELRSPVPTTLAGSAWTVFSALHALCGVLIFLALHDLRSHSATGRYFMVLWALAAALVLGGSFGIAAGINVFRSQWWARSAIVFWSAVSIVSGSMVLIVCVSTWNESFARRTTTQFFHQVL